MDAVNIVFPKVFRGYERKAVNDFILKSNRDFAMESEELRKHIEELSRLLDARDLSIAELKNQIESLKCGLVTRDEQIEKLKRTIDETIRNNAAHIKQTETEFAASLTQKDNEIDTLKSELSFVKSERDELISEKKREEEEKITALDEELNAYREEITAKLRVFTKKCLREILDGVDQMRDDLSSVSDNVGGRAVEMLSNIDSFEDEMKDEVRKTLKDFNV